MRNVTRALVGTLVASLVAGAVSVYAETPTAADFAACDTDAQAGVKASTTTPATKDYVRVESADSAATWTMRVGPISMASSDPQLFGMATDEITDAAYQATYRTCMQWHGF
jgi:hypothetical protein